MDAEERNGPAYFMQNRPHVRLEARVQHVLSSPIAPVGVVPWKPLVCAFVQPSIQCHTHARKKRREGERERRGEKGECITEREMRELYEALHESRSFQSAWVEFFAILLCVYLTVYVRRVWKNCFSSMEKT